MPKSTLPRAMAAPISGGGVSTERISVSPRRTGVPLRHIAGQADALILCDPHRGRFERSLAIKRSRYPRQAGNASQREGSQKLAFRLAHGHRSRLQFAFDLVQEAPVRTLGDDLLRARL